MPIYKAVDTVPEFNVVAGKEVEISEENAKRYGSSFKKVVKTTAQAPEKTADIKTPQETGPSLQEVRGIGRKTLEKLIKVEIATIEELEKAIEEKNEVLTEIIGNEEKIDNIKGSIEELKAK